MPKRRGASPRSPAETEAEAALDASHLRSLASDAREAMLSDAARLSVPAGSTLHREGDTAAHLELVVSGLVRVYVTVPEGRMMTIRYCRRGALIGAVSLFAPKFLLPAAIQAVTDAELVVLDASVITDAIDRDPLLARALLQELSERVLSFISEIPNGFVSVRQRVARHLLDLASEQQTGSELVAALGQQELADAVGSVREVVVRVLRDLRAEGLIRTGRQRVVLLDPDRLAAEVPWPPAAPAPPGPGT